ncbi:pilus assembly protein CpaF [Natronincola peptidivorans]|uniref:Pilus assembly protein CpaF n=1 Tax=Natronincola peptidivorans TaxID=426128 RepID=A0A1I0FQ60_9FIRM|nr:CpaF family protein [Natronincola peptidivorans]SET59721.1 pilus assembly protein CpaF [Natronincola peptidivorans]
MSLLQRIEKQRLTEEDVATKTKAPIKEEKQDKYGELKNKIHKEIIEKLDKELKQGKASEEFLAQRVTELITSCLDRDAGFLPYSERQGITSDIMNEVLGFGPLESLLKNDAITEIMVNGPKQVYVEKSGKITLSDIVFRDHEHVLHIIDKIVSPIGRRIDESMPMVDARLPDGSRVNAIIPPLSLKGPCITIRKFSKDPFKIQDLIRFGTLTPNMGKFLDASVKARLNILISGGTGSGKTTALNVLSSFIPNHERIVTIEDAAELQLHQDHVLSLETRASNIEGKGAITMRDLVKNSLRMRPDRIVVGEVRSGEALDMLQAMNTGHDGSLTTGHANSPRDMLARLETMVLMAGMDLPVRAIREQIASAINIIVQQSRMRDGSRKITHITEVLGMEGDTIVMQDIFNYMQKGLDDKGNIIGEHRASGIVPKFLNRMEEEGITLPKDIFIPSL